MLIDEVLPSCDVREIHQRDVDADVSTTWEAFLGLRPQDVPVARLLFTLRSLPGLVAGRDVLPVRDDATLLEQFALGGFCELARRPGSGLALGVVGRFWTLGGGVVDASAEEFASFDRPGFVRAAMVFEFQETAQGCRVLTETRVAATDEGARRKFAAYWRVVGPFSGLTRREWLRAVVRAAEGVSP